MGDITLANLREAQAGLSGIAEHTPLIPLPLALPHDVRLKAEHRQPIGAFKIRGAWTAIRRLSADARRRGVVTSSSGNHGLGVAYAARKHGIRAVVVMPESAPAVKKDGVRNLGAEVVIAGKTRGPEQGVAAQTFVDEQQLTMIPPFDHPDVIAGQGTVGLEILEDWPEVTTILAPVGGGGLLAGIASAIRATGARIRLIGVEPAGIRKLSAAVSAGHPETLPGGTSLADGLLTMSVGSLTWPLIQDTLDDVIAVTDEDIRAALRWLGQHGHRVEPSGSATTAAVLSGRWTVTGPTALVCTGGNVDQARYVELITE